VDREAIFTAEPEALAPNIPASETTAAPKDMLFSAKRILMRFESLQLLCVFCRVELAGFRDLGQFEKIG
jgi:hypothetical protein